MYGDPCHDSNTIDGDGCSSDSYVEPAWTCVWQQECWVSGDVTTTYTLFTHTHTYLYFYTRPPLPICHVIIVTIAIPQSNRYLRVFRLCVDRHCCWMPRLRQWHIWLPHGRRCHSDDNGRDIFWSGGYLNSWMQMVYMLLVDRL